MDFTALFKIKQAWASFEQNHPKFSCFCRDIGKKGISEGTEVRIIITYPGEEPIEASMRVKDSDMQLMETLRSLSK